MTTYTPEQTYENRRKWFAALRSGKYHQTKGQLESFDGNFCCLGVACNLAAEEGVVNRVRSFSHLMYGKGDLDTNDYSSGTLPQAMMEWLGVKGTHRCIELTLLGDDIPKASRLKGEYKEHVASFNDYHNYDFEAIANLLEKYEASWAIMPEGK